MEIGKSRVDERLGEDREVTDGIAMRAPEMFLVDMERLPPAARRDLGNDIEMTSYVELGMRGVRPCPGRSRGAVLRVRRISCLCLCRWLALVFVI